jgi:hypothetical protein
MLGDSRDFLIRAGLYGETLREGGILLAIFGPIASLEIIRSLPVKLGLAIWSLAAVMLIVGVEFEVYVSRTQREPETTLRIDDSEARGSKDR